MLHNFDFTDITTRKMNFQGECGILNMESIPPNHIVLQCSGEKSMLRSKTRDSRRNSFYTNHSLPNKKLNPIRRKEGKNSLKTSVNVIDLNKNNIFNSEIELLLKYWCLWKSAVKIDTSSKKKIIQRKEIIFSETLDVNNTFKNENDYSFRLHPFHGMKGKKFSNGKYASDKPKIIHKDGNPLRKSLDIQICSDKITLKQCNQDILQFYWNNWKNKIRGRNIVNKIDSFLNVVSVEKKKTIEQYRGKNLADSRRKKDVKAHKMKNKISKGNSLDEVSTAKRHHKTSSSKKGFSNHMLRSLSDKNISVSSLKDEVQTSLKRAHSLLENTIEESLRENHARRINFNHLIRKGSPTPIEMVNSDILERMKIREMERTERWQKLKERRRILEEEKERRILEEEKESVRQKELLKCLKLEERKEKQQCEMEKQKKLEALEQKRVELNLKAAVHYRRRLYRMGICMFRKAVTLKNELLLDADNYYQNKMISKIFIEWRNFCFISKQRQMSLAVGYHRKHLLRFYLKKWMKLQMECTLNEQAAIDFYEMRVQENVILLWHQFTCDMIIEENLKLELADILYRKSLLKKCLLYWKTLPSIVQAERARDKIKNILRQKVLEVIPDFLPDFAED